ncbi:MAG: extracellular solute-binding protein, partial [Verrucomicrobiota bacterium]
NVAADDLSVAPMPGPNGAATVLVGGASLWITADKGDAHAAAAWDYISYLISAASQAAWAAATGYVPIRPDAVDVEPLATTYSTDPRFAVAYTSLVDTPDVPTAVGPLLGPQREVRVLTARALATVLDGGDVQQALTEAEARCTAARADADAARLQLESIQTQRIDFDAALMLKEAQANAWERECRAAKNRADTAARKSATDAQALESAKSELAACRIELEQARAATATPMADPGQARRIHELESELATVSESHARLESQLAETRAMASRAEDLAEQLGLVEAELASLKLESSPAASGQSSPGDLDTLLQDLDNLTRERNRLAAEVASLKASGAKPDSD